MLRDEALYSLELNLSASRRGVKNRRRLHCGRDRRGGWLRRWRFAETEGVRERDYEQASTLGFKIFGSCRL
ncbi:hypothetical protein QN277_009798 [Acacia crassicarpa]|uniref:Uncharacterized protein n=1 Tax=Acacia crassicarpa TaxID=499986 RepID=A0AAE1INX2_9FABA|nr:hypothetical protein QN277_009798 [Acacia crassicarpa]